ncbi:MAG: hypothetical protein P4K98_06850 [Bryobacteraceae bacterium]|nr:hypothetical protein [Bryobacteraceae bacterium]
MFVAQAAGACVYPEAMSGTLGAVAVLAFALAQSSMTAEHRGSGNQQASSVETCKLSERASLDVMQQAVASPLPAPSAADQRRIIEQARVIALDYSKKLPDFICLQKTQRYVDSKGVGQFHRTDVILMRLSYFDEHEDYKVISVNGKRSKKSYSALGGSMSRGEFGSLLRRVFDPASHTEFAFDRWDKLRDRSCLVYTYRVPLAYSKLLIRWHSGERQVITGYSGSIFLDSAEPVAMRLTEQADNIPPSFPIREARIQLDYAYQDVGGRRFLLPARAEMRMRERKDLVKNEVEFTGYLKYSAEAVIRFDADGANSDITPDVGVTPASPEP